MDAGWILVLVLVGWVLEAVGLGAGWLLADDMVIKGKGVTDDHRETMMMLMIRIMTIKKRKEREKKTR